MAHFVIIKYNNASRYFVNLGATVLLGRLKYIFYATSRKLFRSYSIIYFISYIKNYFWINK